MWLLVGEIRRVLARSGQAIPEGNSHQVQMLCTETLKNGEIRENLFTLGTSKPGNFEPFVGKTVVLEASPFARKDGGLGVMLSADVQVKEYQVSAHVKPLPVSAPVGR